MLGVVLLAALVVARTCGSNNVDVSQEEAVALAIEHASFEPCKQRRCVQVRYVPRGIPVQGYWGVVLAEELRPDGEPTRVESFLVNVETGDVTRP
jgi:hypothetical protein